MATPAGWLRDPNGTHEMRYWDGAQWTDHVADGAKQSREPFAPRDPPSPPDSRSDDRRGPEESEFLRHVAARPNRRRIGLLAATVFALIAISAFAFALLTGGDSDRTTVRGSVETKIFSTLDWSGFGGDPCFAKEGAEIHVTEARSPHVVASSALSSRGVVLGNKSTWKAPDLAVCRFRFEISVPHRVEYDFYVEARRFGSWRATFAWIERNHFKISLVN